MVTRPSADCQTTYSRRFKPLWKILKKVTEQSRDSGRRSRDLRPTVKQRFFDVFIHLEKFWKMSLNGHATVVGGHATVGWLSNNVYRRFNQFGNTSKKVTERSRDSGQRSRDRRPTVKQRLSTLQAIKKNLKKVTEWSRDSGQRSRDRRSTVGHHWCGYYLTGWILPQHMLATKLPITCWILQ